MSVFESGPAASVDLLIRAGLAGLASGMRTFTAFAAYAAVTPTPAAHPVDRFLGRTPVRVGVGLAAAWEIVGDKLPQTPDRTAAAPFIGRVTVGAATGAGIATRFGGIARGGEATGHPVLDEAWAPTPMVALSAALAAVGAATTTALGPVYRAALARRFGTDAVGATIEDLCAVALAAIAVRPVSRTGPS